MTTADEKKTTALCLVEDCPYKKCNECNVEDKRNIEKSAGNGFHSTEFVAVKDPTTGKKKYVSKPFE